MFHDDFEENYYKDKDKDKDKLAENNNVTNNKDDFTRVEDVQFKFFAG